MKYTLISPAVIAFGGLCIVVLKFNTGNNVLLFLISAYVLLLFILGFLFYRLSIQERNNVTEKHAEKDVSESLLWAIEFRDALVAIFELDFSPAKLDSQKKILEIRLGVKKAHVKSINVNHVYRDICCLIDKSENIIKDLDAKDKKNYRRICTMQDCNELIFPLKKQLKKYKGIFGSRILQFNKNQTDKVLREEMQICINKVNDIITSLETKLY